MRVKELSCCYGDNLNLTSFSNTNAVNFINCTTPSHRKCIEYHKDY